MSGNATDARTQQNLSEGWDEMGWDGMCRSFSSGLQQSRSSRPNQKPHPQLVIFRGGICCFPECSLNLHERYQETRWSKLFFSFFLFKPFPGFILNRYNCDDRDPRQKKRQKKMFSCTTNDRLYINIHIYIYIFETTHKH